MPSYIRPINRYITSQLGGDGPLGFRCMIILLPSAAIARASVGDALERGEDVCSRKSSKQPF
jgi:hypothetical protein